VTVRVNDRAASVWAWSRWRDAATAADPAWGAALSAGRASLYDALGEPLDPDGRVVPGAAIRCDAQPERGNR
jgi:hypothetical protein